jgi:hypothetical protein
MVDACKSVSESNLYMFLNIEYSIMYWRIELIWLANSFIIFSF